MSPFSHQIQFSHFYDVVFYLPSKVLGPWTYIEKFNVEKIIIQCRKKDKCLTKKKCRKKNNMLKINNSMLKKNNKIEKKTNTYKNSLSKSNGSRKR